MNCQIRKTLDTNKKLNKQISKLFFTIDRKAYQKPRITYSNFIYKKTFSFNI